MQIDNNSINFKGIYRLPFSEENFRRIPQVIEPYKIYRNKPAFAFTDKSASDAMNNILEIVADKEHASVSWLNQNAKRHDIDLSEALETSIMVVTGKEDNEKVKRFFDKESGMFSKIKLINHLRNVNIPKDLPNHLRPIYLVKNGINYIKGKFNNFYEEHNIINVNSLQELAQKISMEK